MPSKQRFDGILRGLYLFLRFSLALIPPREAEKRIRGPWWGPNCFLLGQPIRTAKRRRTAHFLATDRRPRAIAEQLQDLRAGEPLFLSFAHFHRADRQRI